MKGIVFYISLLLSLNVCGQYISINGGATWATMLNATGKTVSVNPFFRTKTAIDNGNYDGFPMVCDEQNREAWGIYKKSSSHANAGALMLIHTTDFGQTWTEDSIYVDGVAISSSNHSFARLPTGRMLISYRVSSTLYFAYNDNSNKYFTSTGTPIVPATDYDIAQSPNKMILSSYGKVLFVYYQTGNNGNPSSAIIMQSADSGLTWSQKSVIYTSNNVYSAGFPNCRGNEAAICELYPTGNEATSKWMAIIRPEVANDGGGYYMIYRSTDGGNTWAQDVSTASGSFVDDNGQTIAGNFSKSGLYLFLSSNSPVAMRVVGDSLYVVNGNRNITHGYGLVYLSAKIDSAWSNTITSWVRHPYIKSYYANLAGSFLDCGYPTIFQSGNNIMVAEYDVSPYAALPGVTRRCLIETVRIK